MVFSGCLSLLDEPNETVPVYNESKRRVDHAHAHLVESIGIKGLSGSPVFVRPSADIEDMIARQDGHKTVVKLPLSEAYLLGLFQAAWFLPPDETLRREHGANVADTVPVGLGIVVPAQKIIDLLESPAVKKPRTERLTRAAAKQTVSSIPVAAAEVPVDPKGPNPQAS